MTMLNSPLGLALHYNDESFSALLLDAGAKLDEVDARWISPNMMRYAQSVVLSRKNAHKSSVVVLGVAMCGSGRRIDKNVLKMVARCIWSTRVDVAWASSRAQWCVVQ